MIIRHAVSLLVITVFSLLLVGSLTPFGSATTPDSINYLDAAGNFNSGLGLLLTDHSLENHDGRLYNHMEQWPPLYPLMLAVTSFGQPDVVTASRLSAALLALTALFAYLLLVTFLKWYLALPAALLLCLTVPLMTVYTYAWSETLFIPLLLAAAWAAIRYLDTLSDTAGGKHRYLAMLVVMLIALAYTRYTGIALALLLPATFLLGDRRHRSLPAFAVAAGAYCAAVGYLLAGHHLLAGSLIGVARLLPDRGLLQNLHDILNILLTSAHSSLPVMLLILAAATAVSLIYAVSVQIRCTRLPSVPRNTRNILLLVGLIYLATLLVLRINSSFNRLDARLLAPAACVLWILLAVILAEMKPYNKRRLLAQVILWCCVIVLPVKGYSHLQESIRNWLILGSPKHVAVGSVIFNNYTIPDQENQLRSLYSKLATEGAVVVTEQPLTFEHVTGIRSLQLPETIDIESIDKFNTLPVGSLILLPNDAQQKGMLKLRLEHNLIYEYLHIGEQIAVRTPILVEPAN